MNSRKSLSLVLVSILMPLSLASWSSCQDLDVTPEATGSQDDDSQLTAEERYLQNKSELRKTEKKINDLYINLDLGSQGIRSKQLEEIQKLQQQEDQLVVEVYESAVDTVRDSEELDPRLAHSLQEYAIASMGGGIRRVPYSPAKTVEICDLLEERGVERANFFNLKFRAKMASLEFEEIRSIVDEAVEIGVTFPQSFMDNLDTAEQKWIREKSFRSAESNLPKIRLETELGDIELVLYEDQAPNAVKNFVSLIDKDFFKGLEFFEAKRGVQVRSGCAQNTGSAPSAYTIASEAESENARHHFPGSISMMTDERLNVCYSQFIITQRPLPHLDGRYPVIGRVVSGLDILDQIVRATDSSNVSGGPRVVIDSIEVLNLRADTTYVPEKMDQN